MMTPVSGQSDELRIREVLTAILLVYQHTLGQLLRRVMPVADLTGRERELFLRIVPNRVTGRRIKPA